MLLRWESAHFFVLFPNKKTCVGRERSKEAEQNQHFEKQRNLTLKFGSFSRYSSVCLLFIFEWKRLWGSEGGLSFWNRTHRICRNLCLQVFIVSEFFFGGSFSRNSTGTQLSCVNGYWSEKSLACSSLWGFEFTAMDTAAVQGKDFKSTN